VKNTTFTTYEIHLKLVPANPKSVMEEHSEDKDIKQNEMLCLIYNSSLFDLATCNLYLQGGVQVILSLVMLARNIKHPKLEGLNPATPGTCGKSNNT